MTFNTTFKLVDGLIESKLRVVVVAMQHVVVGGGGGVPGALFTTIAGPRKLFDIQKLLFSG